MLYFKHMKSWHSSQKQKEKKKKRQAFDKAFGQNRKQPWKFFGYFWGGLGGETT